MLTCPIGKCNVLTNGLTVNSKMPVKWKPMLLSTTKYSDSENIEYTTT